MQKTKIEYFTNRRVAEPVTGIQAAFNRSIIMDDDEFDILIRRQCVLIGKRNIAWEMEGKELKGTLSVFIYGMRGTSKKDDIETQIIYSFYVRWNYFVWRVSDVEDAVQTVEVIRQYEINHQAKREESMKKYSAKRMKVLKSKKAA